MFLREHGNVDSAYVTHVVPHQHSSSFKTQGCRVVFVTYLYLSLKRKIPACLRWKKKKKESVLSCVLFCEKIFCTLCLAENH